MLFTKKIQTLSQWGRGIPLPRLPYRLRRRIFDARPIRPVWYLRIRLCAYWLLLENICCLSAYVGLSLAVKIVITVVVICSIALTYYCPYLVLLLWPQTFRNSTWNYFVAFSALMCFLL